MPVYGIDLGTTNSLIGLHSTGFLSDIVPSCVNLKTGEAGAKQYDNMDAKRSFKVDMSMGVEGSVPRYASRFVLEELCRQVKDDTVKDVVISVPAYFNDSQRTATIAAADDAGLNVLGLVNEPTAAAMYIAKDKKGLFVVYDLGGGTFDVSIVDSRFSMYDVQATSGRVIGGDNFDINIMRFFVKNANIPIHKLNDTQRIKLQHFCSSLKVQLQKQKTDIHVDLTEFGGNMFTWTTDAYKQLMRMTFSETITLLQQLISKWIPSDEVFEILLIGGSTHCPYLREWIEEVTGRKPAPLTYDPDRVVALGAALYADLVAEGNINSQVSDVTKALSVGLHDGTVSTVIPANSKIPLSMEKMFTNPFPTNALELSLYQGESLLAKDNEMIGTLIWNYDSFKETREGEVIVTVSVDNKGVISFSANELLTEPKTVVLRRE